MVLRHNSSPTWRRLGVHAAVALAIVVAGAPAFAESTAEGSDLIRTLGCDEELLAFKEGEKLAEAGNYETARLEFARAWKVWRFPDVLFKLAVAEERSGHPVEAVASYGELMALTEPDTSYMRVVATYASFDAKAMEAIRVQADQSLALLIHHLGEVEVSCPLGTRLTVDGRAATVVDGRLWVTPGKHVVVATQTGKTETVNVDAKAGVWKKLTLLGGADRR